MIYLWVRKPIMKVIDQEITIESSGIQSQSFFKLDEENLAHLFKILRDSTYSNKPLALLREYSTNAYDAHVEANKADTPIKVVLPNYIQNTLKIRDYGFGLDEEDIYNVYASYGKSTKRNSNLAVGYMGIGCKCAFCYSSSFTIVSYHNGIKKTYSAYLDETNIGKIAKVNETPTDETGLEIIIDVKREDIYTFQKEALNFFAEFNPTPVLVNFDYKLEAPSFIVREEGYGIFKNHNKHILRMGNVDYPFSSYDLELDACFQRTYVKIYAEIGDVIPVTSREALDFNKKTKDYIQNQMKLIKEKMSQALINEFENCSSHYAFEKLWKERYHLRTVLNLDYKHSKYTPSSFDIKKYYEHTEWKMCENDNKSFKKVSTFNLNSKIFLYVTGELTLQDVRSRLINLNDRNGYIFKFDTREEMDKFRNEPELLGLETTDISTLKEGQIVRNYKLKNKRGKAVQAEIYEFVANRNLLADSWKEATTLEEPKVYVLIKNFKPVLHKHDSGMDMSAFNQLLSMLSTFITIPKIYGIKIKDKDLVEDDMVEFYSYINNLLRDMDKKTLEQINFKYVMTKLHYADILQKYIKDGFDTNIPELQSFYNVHARFSYQVVDIILIAGFKINFEQGDNIIKMSERFVNDRPMFQLLFNIVSIDSFLKPNRDKALNFLNSYAKKELGC